MDIRTGKIYEMDDCGATETVVGKDGRTYKVINGENCINHCALANKRNCYIRAAFGRAQCRDFVPTNRNI